MKKAIQIKDNMYWVGVHDFNLRHFHGDLFPIEDGTSYNAYLIVDKEITLIDTVEEEFMDIMLERIHSIIQDQPINHVIVQHAEPDHSSGFLRFMKEYPNAQAYASNAGVQIMLKQYFHEYNFQKVKTWDTLCTGQYTLSFIEMPLIHWPDNMMTYIDDAKILFSNDAFGQHILSYQLYDEDHGLLPCIEKAKEYYANIVMPYGDQVRKKLQDIEAQKIAIEMIAPAHGIIWKQYVKEILDSYQQFASFQSKSKAVIVYESVWNHTQMMAEALAEGLGISGIQVHVFKLSQTNSALLMKEILDAKVVLVGSGCYNNAMNPGIAGFLEKLKSNNLKHKFGLGFGSYGWFPKVASTIHHKLAEAGLTLLQESALSQNYTPSNQDLGQLINIGEQIAEQIKIK